MDRIDAVKEIGRLLAGQRQVFITSHTFPDGDSIGSMVALLLVLQQQGTEVIAVNADPVPEMYSFLKGAGTISRPVTDLLLPPVTVFLDCTDVERAGEEVAAMMARQQPPVVINIDHHVSNTFFGTCNYVDGSAAATAELIYPVLAEMGTVDKDIATALYTALATDTGSFRFASTTAATYRLAAELLDRGVELAAVNVKLWEEKPATSIILLSRVLPTLQLAAGGRIAWMHLEKNVFDSLAARSEHCEGFVDYPRSIAGVEVGMFFREVEKDEVKVSLRSKAYFDVNRLAGQFGGGGHQRAAACTIYAPMGQAIDQVVAAAVRMLES